MEWVNRVLAGVIVYASCKLFAIPLAFILTQRDAATTAQYASEALPGVVQEEAKYLGITAPAPPTLRSMEENPYASYTNIGAYDSATNELYISFGQNYTPGTSAALVARFAVEGLVQDVRNTLRHETSHYLTDVIAEDAGTDLSFDSKSIHFVIQRRLIMEGIATYMTRPSCANVQTQWPAAWDGIEFLQTQTNTLLYDGGCAIVAPIVEKYRAEGIRYLVTHLPIIPSPRDLPAYRESILRALEKK